MIEMAMTENETNNRFDIRDPSDNVSVPADIAVEPTETATGEANVEKIAPATPSRNRVAEPESVEISDYLDEVAGREISNLRKEIQELRSMVASTPKREPQREQPTSPPLGSRVEHRQSQFVARTSSRDSSIVSPTDRAVRSVEELMRKRNLL